MFVSRFRGTRVQGGVLEVVPSIAVLLAISILIAGALAPAADAAEAPLRVREVPVPSADLLGPEVPARGAEHPFSPPPNPEVGDSWYWWLFLHVGTPHFEQRLCTVRAKTANGYLVVDDSEWNVRIFQSDVDQIMERWENTSIGAEPTKGIYELNTQYFGEPPDELDNDPRIYNLWFNFGSPTIGDGHFFSFDEEPDGANPGLRSNECEVVYLNTVATHAPSSDYMISVLAHEFEHMIHWLYDENELSWVDEGMAELAMWYYGRPDVISSFNANPDNNLTVWNSVWADYIKTYLWSLYFKERFGDAAVYDVVHEPGNSYQGYDAVLDLHGATQDFADVFADWAVANYLDDTSIGDGRFGYAGDELPPFNHSATHSTYPVGPINAAVNHWATDYVQFLDVPAGGLHLEFDGYDFSGFAVWALELDPVEPTRVTRVILDANQNGMIDLPDVGGLYERAVMVVAKNSPSGLTSYAYSAATGTTGVGQPATVIATRLELDTPVPNPFNPSVEIRFALPDAATHARLTVVDPAGRHVRTLIDGALAAGDGAVRWDGLDDTRRGVASGVYYFRLETADGTQTTRATLLR
ncbi:MAG: FlgD immunoglobulin-like domain containing protein [Candidatus Eiseniibacteriota bacterium]